MTLREQFFSELKRIAIQDIKNGHTTDILINNSIEELGEFSKAYAVEQGYKDGNLVESSQEEAVDVIICAMALLYSVGGTDEHLYSYGLKKLKKWEEKSKFSN